jgi:hypothetical protein
MILSAKAKEDCLRGMTRRVRGDRVGALADFPGWAGPLHLLADEAMRRRSP